MTNIINRLAWGVSIGLAFTFLFIFFQRDFYDEISITFVLVVFLAPIIKKILFSKSYIESQFDANPPRAQIIPSPVPQIAIDETSLVDRTVPSKQKLEPEQVVMALNKESVAKDTEVMSDVLQILASEKNKNYVANETLSEKEPAPMATPPKPGIFHEFFKENALAKVGSILLFLSILFLMQLVYNKIGPIGKLMLGFLISFLVFIVGVILEKKNLHRESRVLMGTAVLINYLVILSGRYLIGDGMYIKQLLLNESVTFFLLILNTIFAVSVAMAHKSKLILVFAILGAYLNPFLINEKMNLTVYTLLAYSFVVSMGAISLSIFYKKYHVATAKLLLLGAFVGGNILVLSAPSINYWQWLLKLSVLLILTLTCAYYAYFSKFNELLVGVLGGAYLFLLILILSAQSSFWKFYSIGTTLSIAIVLSMLALVSLYFFLNSMLVPIYYLLLAPLAIILLFFQMHILVLGGLVYLLMGALFYYLLVFALVSNKLSQFFAYIYFLVLGAFTVLMSLIWNINNLRLHDSFSIYENHGIALAVFLFLFSAYYFSGRKDLEKLYTISTLASAFVLPIIIERSGPFKTASVICSVLFVLANILWPLIKKSLLFTALSNLVLGVLIGSVFSVYEIFYFWGGELGQSKMSLGLSFMLIAIVYFLVSYFYYLAIDGHNKLIESGEEKVEISDAVYPIIGISLSLFALAIIYIFSKHSEIISAILIFESAVLFYFYSQKKIEKIYFAGLAFMALGLVKMTLLVDLVNAREYSLLIAMFFILAAFAAIIKFLNCEEQGVKIFSDLGIIIGVLLILSIVNRIVPDNANGMSILASAIYLFLLAMIFGLAKSDVLRYFYVGLFSVILLFHVSNIGSIFKRIDHADLGFLKIFQYISSILFLFSAIIFNKIPRIQQTGEGFKKLGVFALSVVMAIYIFIISTQYVYYLFGEIEFVITIYWGLVSLLFLSFGIQNNRIKPRTLGLYILVLAVLKILLLDIWSGLEDAIMRVIALMVVGVIMISISILYSKKYDNNLKGEFDFANFMK